MIWIKWFKKLISLSASIASNAFRITFGAILKKPFQAIINTVRNLLTGARNKIGKFVAEAGEGLLKNIGRGLLGALPFVATGTQLDFCLLYTSPSPRDVEESRMPSSA